MPKRPIHTPVQMFACDWALHLVRGVGAIDPPNGKQGSMATALAKLLVKRPPRVCDGAVANVDELCARQDLAHVGGIANVAYMCHGMWHVAWYVACGMACGMVCDHDMWHGMWHGMWP